MRTRLICILLGMNLIMSGIVYAGNETILGPGVTWEQGDGESISECPDSSVSPPAPPAVPVPYPKIPSGSDSTTGSEKIEFGPKTPAHKDTNFSKSRGDEEGTGTIDYAE